MTTNPNHWTTAQRICTHRELEVLQLRHHGLSYRTISLHLGISVQRAHQLANRASQKIELELRKETAA